MAWLHRAQEVSIYYEVWGEQGPWLTLINGHTRSSADFKLFAQRFSKDGMRVLLFDNRGAGKTQTPLGFSLDDMAEDVLALWAALDIERSHLLGLSMGGFIASWLASQPQQRVERLALVSTAKDPRTLPSGRDGEWPAELPGIEKRLRRYFTPEFLSRNQLLLQAMAKNIHQQVSTGEFQAKARAQAQAMGRFFQVPPLWQQIAVPTLIVHGGQDQIVPVGEAVQLQHAIPQATLVRWEEAGHLLLAENAARLYAQLLDFFQGKLAGSAPG